MENHEQVLCEFAEFRLDPRRRILVRGGEPVPLPPKAFDTLLFLVKNPGRIVEKEELMKALWPESFVEEGNLTQNVFVLRKILGNDQNGDSFIKTIPRRGYKFVPPVRLLKVPCSVVQPALPREYWSRHSPFRGLQRFEPDDAWLFFGRDSETNELLVRLSRFPVLVVMGNSGCGKSSLIRAGLIPGLHQGRFCHRGDCGNFSLREPSACITCENSWKIAITRPSQAPFDYLAEVLPHQLAPEMDLSKQAEFIADCRNKLPLGEETLRNTIAALVNATAQNPGRVLLVVDQFEEIFTLIATHDIRERYINLLLAASRWDSSVPMHLVLIVQADFYSRCLEHPGLSRWLESNLYNVPCMARNQLRVAMEKRLALTGTRVESGLIDSLLDDISDKPGGLALLEHTLTRLWEKCGGGFGCAFTNSAYLEIASPDDVSSRAANTAAQKPERWRPLITSRSEKPHRCRSRCGTSS